MFRIVSTRYSCCEAKASVKAPSAPWILSKSASTSRKRKPSRMILSADVSIPREPETVGRRTSRRRQNGPFGGMNVTQLPGQTKNATERVISPKRAESRQMRGSDRSNRAAKTRSDPMKALKMQRALASVSYGQRTRIKEAIQDYESFDDFDLLPSIKDAVASQTLQGMTNISPTPIQRLAIPALLGNVRGRKKKVIDTRTSGKKELQQFLLAAETGSGKTLAYSLPVIHAIKRAEIAEDERVMKEAASEATTKKRDPFGLEPAEADVPHPTSGRPRAIVLLPTAELVSQVGAVLKSLCHGVKFRVAIISASYSATVIKSRVFSSGGVDVVVSTPHLLKSITQSDPNLLSRVSHLIIDEADSLLDRSFSPITSEIIDRATPSLEQLILCSATIPRSLNSYLDKRYPQINRLATPNLHAIPRRVQLTVVDIEKMPYQGNRDLACAQTIRDIGRDATDHGEEHQKKIVVFVNERERAIELAAYLRSKNIDAHALARDSDERKDATVLAAFTGVRNKETKSETFPEAISPGDLTESAVAQRTELSPYMTVLVTTDLGSRGIDTLLARYVVLYDVPHTSIDFIHRLGRVGRMGRRGRGIVLVGKRDRKDIVREVREGMFKGQALI